MSISTVISKRRRRVIGISYAEAGLPHTEVIINGKRVDTISNFIYERSLFTLPFSVKLFHRNFFLRKFHKYFAKLQKLPTKYVDNESTKTIEKLHVKKLIIGGGTSGIAALNNDSLLITPELIGDIQYDESPIPDINRDKLLTELKEKIKSFNNRILIGKFLGKFEEGLLFETESKYLLVSAEEIIISTGGRTIRPLFKNNYIPRIISRELYLKRYKNIQSTIAVLGFTDITARTALNSKKAYVIYPKHVKLKISKFYVENLEKQGVELINENILDVKLKDKNSIELITESRNIIVDFVVFSVTKQPRLEIAYNIGLPYKLNKSLHIYQPQPSNNVKVIGGAFGIMNEYLSYLSGIHTLDEKLVSEYEPELLDNDHQSTSPYKYGEAGIVCECEDLDWNDIKFAVNLGFKDVESVKRITGLGTGHCQGKVCSYLLGSLLESNNLISFRSPLYPVNL